MKTHRKVCVFLPPGTPARIGGQPSSGSLCASSLIPLICSRCRADVSRTAPDQACPTLCSTVVGITLPICSFRRGVGASPIPTYSIVFPSQFLFFRVSFTWRQSQTQSFQYVIRCETNKPCAQPYRRASFLSVLFYFHSILVQAEICFKFYFFSQT